ncbi:hypothetical protein FRC08_001674 [Ceratobasidium sp. 394]|nr:hypothetical protein FRC08_001674 [Ceratobasidium sp. 394]
MRATPSSAPVFRLGKVSNSPQSLVSKAYAFPIPSLSSRLNFFLGQNPPWAASTCASSRRTNPRPLFDSVKLLRPTDQLCLDIFSNIPAISKFHAQFLIYTSLDMPLLHVSWDCRKYQNCTSLLPGSDKGPTIRVMATRGACFRCLLPSEHYNSERI